MCSLRLGTGTFTIDIDPLRAINHDPRYFPDHDEFRPERYIDVSGRLAEPIPDTHGLGHLSFGSGRRYAHTQSFGRAWALTVGVHRICVGKDFANQTLFIFIVAMLWAFDIKVPIGSDGVPMTPSRNECVDTGIVV